MRAAQAFDNFDAVYRTRAFQGWDSSPVCSWTGVMCSAQKNVTGLNFTTASPPPQPVQANMGRDIALSGGASSGSERLECALSALRVTSPTALTVASRNVLGMAAWRELVSCSVVVHRLGACLPARNEAGHASSVRLGKA